jgi:hypothetical protein
MEYGNLDTQQTARGVRYVAGIVALGMTLTVAAPRAAHAEDKIVPPSVPDQIKVDAGNKVSFIGHGVGTQNYVCLPSANGVAFQLFTPEATLFNDQGKQLTSHFFSPNVSPDGDAGPNELNTIRATWEDSRDTSTVWAKATASATFATDPTFVDPHAVAWLLLDVVGRRDGPTRGDRLTDTTFIQRVNTAGGLAPSTGCTSPADIGREAFVPYTADYVFFKHEGR